MADTPPAGVAGLALPNTPAPNSGATPPQNPPATPPTPPVEPPKAPEAPPVVVTSEDFKRLGAEVDKTGDLSEESYKALEAKGLAREVVKEYVDGRKAVVQSQLNAVFSEAGGKESFERISAWASTNLTEAQKLAFNNTLASGDMGAITLAVRGLKAQYAEKYGNDPVFTGGKAGPSGPVPFNSMREVVDAMKAPEWGKSEAYRASVQARLAASPFARS